METFDRQRLVDIFHCYCFSAAVAWNKYEKTKERHKYTEALIKTTKAKTIGELIEHDAEKHIKLIKNDLNGVNLK